MRLCADLGFKCNPHRVLAKKVEPLVWNEFTKLLTNEQFIKNLLEKVTAIHRDNDDHKERERLKAKQYGLNSQIDALAERIAILPREISPTPLFKQLEKIQNVKKEVDEKLNTLKDVNIDDRLVPLKTFQKFAEYSKFILNENPDFNVRRKILQKFVRRVEIGPDSVKIYWNVDKEFYSNEVIISSNKEPSQAKACDPCKAEKNVRNVGSNSFTNGARKRT